MFEIMSSIRTKDKNAITLLYNRYGKKLYGYAIVKWNLSEDEAWEIVYKTLYKVIDVIDKYTFENENKFVGFLFKIFINYLRNYYRDNKNKNIETIELSEKHEKISNRKSDSVDANTPQSIQMTYLQEELQKLEDWQRIVLLMRAQDYPYEEIAKFVNKPIEQLKVYHMRLKKQITDKINNRINPS